MEMQGLPKPGDIVNRSKDKPYQIVAIATNADTGDAMVVYQALFGDFITYVGTPERFLQEVSENHEVIAAANLHSNQSETRQTYVQKNAINEKYVNRMDGEVNAILLKFLDAESYHKKLEVITSNAKHLNDRLVNDMAVALDCTVDDGPLDVRIQELIYCLQAMSRFENKRLR